MSDSILDQLAEIVGTQRLVTGAELSGYEFPWSTHAGCRAKAAVFPASTDEVSKVLATCNQQRQTVVPFGGTTNLVQGCATESTDIVLSLARMNRIEELDKRAHTLTAEAGVTLQEAQEAARNSALYFPVDIGARSNCMLGGIVSTNAGGTKVIRYGMTRDSVLGLEAVLADGTVLSSMNRYIKNNSGLDLKHLFIGSEGILGVVTRLVFRLAEEARTHNVALLACDSFDDVVTTLNVAHEMLPNTLTAFEVMWRRFYEQAVMPKGRLQALLEPGYAFYIVLESMGADREHDDLAFEATLERLMREETVVDGLVAKSDSERSRIWEIRHEVEPIIATSHNFDVSLKSADVGAYVEAVDAAVTGAVAGTTVVGFGHLGDNNVHVSVQMSDKSAERVKAVEEIVYEQLRPFGGAISAEHGIGLEKKAYLPISRTPAEIELMTRLKRMMDPNNILNPGKVVDAS